MELYRNSTGTVQELLISSTGRLQELYRKRCPWPAGRLSDPRERLPQTQRTASEVLISAARQQFSSLPAGKGRVEVHGPGRNLCTPRYDRTPWTSVAGCAHKAAVTAGVSFVRRPRLWGCQTGSSRAYLQENEAAANSCFS